ncbi:uncharacterized protein LOC132639608 [Lycium barbarum]|uniref:uncharacterized protein LOC132639608 n=1 Tax=Lycium barbarum TaxID=112863 RepID=UPI00293EC2E9|nr:uncharacterized protein LOC132639608 [Lycium barbarum]
MDSILGMVEEKIAAACNVSLTRLFTIDDVKEAIFSMHPDKAPGPDGLNPSFYQSFWLWSVRICLMGYSIVSIIMESFRDCIAEAQSAFITNRYIFDNAMISFEINHNLKRKTQGKIGFATLKTDTNKACDRVKWNFLKNMMDWCSRSDKLIVGLLGLEVVESEANTIKHCLLLYQKVSGQQVNFHKSKVYFSKNNTDEVKDVVASILHVKKVDKPGQYLGLPTSLGRNKKEVFNFILAKKGCVKCIGNGLDTKIFNDPWLPTGQSMFIRSILDEGLLDLRVMDIID